MDIERDDEYIYVSQKCYITRMAAEYQNLLATYKGNLRQLGATARRVIKARARLQMTQREEDHQDAAEEEDDET